MEHTSPDAPTAASAATILSATTVQSVDPVVRRASAISINIRYARQDMSVRMSSENQEGKRPSEDGRTSIVQASLVVALALAMVLASMAYLDGEERGQAQLSVDAEGALLLSQGADVVARAVSLETRIAIRGGAGDRVSVTLTNLDPTRTSLQPILKCHNKVSYFSLSDGNY